jgi:hypothetical protein
LVNFLIHFFLGAAASSTACALALARGVAAALRRFGA